MHLRLACPTLAHAPRCRHRCCAALNRRWRMHHTSTCPLGRTLTLALRCPMQGCCSTRHRHAYRVPRMPLMRAFTGPGTTACLPSAALPVLCRSHAHVRTRHASHAHTPQRHSRAAERRYTMSASSAHHAPPRHSRAAERCHNTPFLQRAPRGRGVGLPTPTGRYRLQPPLCC